MLLAIADDGSQTAYEFMAELKRLFPAYRPSPGGVYPAISALAKERLLKASRDGRAKRYEITPAGRAALERRRSDLAALQTKTGTRLGDDGSLRPVLDRFVVRVLQNSGHVEPARVAEVLDRAAAEIEEMRGLHGQAR